MGGPLRVLHVVVNMNRGGAETLIMNLYRNIDRSKVQFDFLTCKEGVFDSEILELGGRIHRIPYISDVGHFGYVKGLDEFFKENSHYMIVHAHMDKMSGLVLRAAKKAGISVRIAHSHSTRSEGSKIANLYKWYAGNFILSNATQFLACSESAGEWLFRKKSDSFRIMKNGIDSEKFSFSLDKREMVRSELGINSGTVVIGHVGRFSEPKNHMCLLDIFAQFTKQNKDSLLLLVGDGPLKTEVEKKALQLNILEKVIFLGVRRDVEIILQAFDLFVFPSIYEGLPVTLVEAQYAGLQCYVSDHISTEVDLNFGLIKFLSLSNITEWVNKIEHDLINKADRNLPEKSKEEKDYEIKNTTVWAEKFYFSLGK